MKLNTVLELGALTQGSTYTFLLTAFATGTDDDANVVSGYAETTVVVNAPPSSGTFTASPSSGTALVTTFTLTASSWVDDASDLPLQYSFRSAPGAAAAAATIADASEQVEQAYSTATTYSGLLAEGDSATGVVSSPPHRGVD